jgi:hypothetical protein
MGELALKIGKHLEGIPMSDVRQILTLAVSFVLKKSYPDRRRRDDALEELVDSIRNDWNHDASSKH